MTYFQKLIGHLRTVNRHRAEVRKLCFKCGLYWQGITHDLSKYSPTEFLNGVKFYTGTGSPHIGERNANGYSAAWLHHKGRNKHHAEYWHDIQPDGTTKPILMPPEYFAEMVCDRVAASKIYLKDKYTDDAPLNYYLTHKDENEFEPNTRIALENILGRIATIGTDAAFAEIAKFFKERKKSL